MVLGIVAAAAALVVVVADVLAPRVVRRWHARQRQPRPAEPPVLHDPGRERRAEQKARALLRSCVNPEDWEMYRDLGFLRVWSAAEQQGGERCAYLIYPHQPIVSYVPKTRRFAGEYCVSFEDSSKPYGSGRLPDSDDVLAKWMALTGDERRLISVANMHLPGRQVEPRQVERDLRRLTQWEQERARRAALASPAPARQVASAAPAGQVASAAQARQVASAPPATPAPPIAGSSTVS